MIALCNCIVQKHRTHFDSRTGTKSCFERQKRTEKKTQVTKVLNNLTVNEGE